MRLKVGLLVLALCAPVLPFAPVADVETARPNLIVIMTDDQTLESMRFLPRTRLLLGEHGVTYENSFVSHPLCCPSRTTLLTGLYAHRHGVLDNTEAPARFPLEGTLPLRLQAAGYRTIHVGKYLNDFGAGDETAIPPGWNRWNGLLDPGTYRMYGYRLNRNGVVRTIGRSEVEAPRQYQTDVLARIARDELRRAADDAPFFLNLAFLAPHTENRRERRETLRDPRPAPRHEQRFERLRAPRPPSFDEPEIDDKSTWMRRRGRFSDGWISRIDAAYRSRARALLAVDEAVGSLVATLAEIGELEDTLIVFTSDNGYFHGEHRIGYGKFLPYEESIRVPLLIRGPGFPAGVVRDRLVLNVDLAPTLLTAAGLPVAELDGEPLQVRAPGEERLLLIETMRTGDDPLALLTRLDLEDRYVLPYQALRSRRFVYIRFADGDVEFYDLERDPYQLDNLASEAAYATVVSWFAAQLEPIAACSGPSCRDRTRVDVPVEPLTDLG